MTKFKYHDNVRDSLSPLPELRIYDFNTLPTLPRNYRRLSIMKQENIRTALQEGIRLELIREVIGSKCGYCSKFARETYVGLNCSKCPLRRQLGQPCFKLDEFKELATRPFSSLLRDQVADLHEKWCKQIGLWKDMKIR